MNSFGQQGWLDINILLNCNKIKELKAGENDIVEAIKDSDKLEVSQDSKKIRRANNAPLPEKIAKGSNGTNSKKRDAKAEDKEESKKDESKEQEIEYDERGNPILAPQDFENP